MTPDELTQGVLQRLATGNKIEAIKFYREATHASLVDAKNTVEAMAEGRPGAMPAPAALQAAMSAGEVEALIRRGLKIDAIKAYREKTGLGLADAKSAVERMQAQIERGEPVSEPRPRAPGGAPAPSAVAEGTVESLIRAGRKLDAIKVFREKTGLGLAESKAAIDMMQAQIERGAPVSEPADPSPVVAPGPALSAFGGAAAPTFGSSVPAPTRKAFSSDDLERTNPTPSGFVFFVVFAVIVATGGALAYLMSGR